MKEKIKTEFYASPDVEVIEVKTRQVMCTSTGDMTVDDPYNF